MEPDILIETPPAVIVTVPEPAPIVDAIGQPLSIGDMVLVPVSSGSLETGVYLGQVKSNASIAKVQVLTWSMMYAVSHFEDVTNPQFRYYNKIPAYRRVFYTSLVKAEPQHVKQVSRVQAYTRALNVLWAQGKIK